MKLAVLVANRGFFPSSVIESARKEMAEAVERAGAEALMSDPGLTRFGAVEIRAEGEAFAGFLEEHAGEYEGLIICLPNFGDENGIKEAIKDVRVPILLQAYPDEPGKLDFANRRDAFCGKLGLCSVLKQMGIPFVSGEPFVMHPFSEAFAAELSDFIAICRIVSRMRHLRIGVIGARTTAFKSVRFDESALERHGADVETLDLTQVFERMERIGEDDARIAEWEREIRKISDVSDAPAAALTDQCRLGIALEELRSEMKLDAMAIRCWNELQYAFRVTPCTVMGIFNGMQVPVVCETDVTNAPAMLALTLASGAGAGCLDVNNNYGDDPDKCILFHCGPLPINLMAAPGHMEEHKMFVKTQGEDCSWGVNAGRIKPGPVTICGMRTENGEVRFFIEKAQVMDIKVDAGYFGTYGVVQLDGLQTKLRHMAEQGFRHHVVIAGGDQTRRVREALTKYLGYTEILI